jgi:hypothetical protein
MRATKFGARPLNRRLSPRKARLEGGLNLPPRGIGAKLLDRKNLAAELSGQNYSDKSTGKILGGNMMRVLRKVVRWSSCPQLAGQLEVFLSEHVFRVEQASPSLKSRLMPDPMATS